MKTAILEKWDVLSPDGISIHPTAVYPSLKAARKAFREWAKRYRIQGYYSTVVCGERIRIPLKELEEWCEYINITNNEYGKSADESDFE